MQIRYVINRRHQTFSLCTSQVDYLTSWMTFFVAGHSWTVHSQCPRLDVGDWCVHNAATVDDTADVCLLREMSIVVVSSRSSMTWIWKPYAKGVGVPLLEVSLERGSLPACKLLCKSGVHIVMNLRASLLRPRLAIWVTTAGSTQVMTSRYRWQIWCYLVAGFFYLVMSESKC